MQADLSIGPYPLEWCVIDRAIIRRSAGLILLGDMAQNGRRFLPHAVRLATFDIKRELFALVEEAEYSYFRCAYAPTELAARRYHTQWRDALAHRDDARIIAPFAAKREAAR